MEPLFQTDLVYTYEIYEAFNKLVFGKSLHKLTILIAILFPLMTFFLYLMHTVQLLIFFAIFTAVYPFLLIFARKRAIKKTWQSNKILQDQQMHYDFYDDRAVQISPLGNAACEYEKLYDVLENDRLICLMISNNQGMAILKENCSEELLQFLKKLKHR